MSVVWSMAKLVVSAQVNSSQFSQFLAKHGGDVPAFSAEVPVYSLEDDALEAAWGTASLPVSTRHRIATETTVQYFFRTRGTPPITWVTRVSKTYRDLMFRLDYAVPALSLQGWVMRRGDVTKTFESDGDREAVDAFLLSLE